VRGQGFSNADALLGYLLDRVEANPGATRLLARIDYNGFHTVAEEDAFFQRLSAVEGDGGISLRRTGRKGEEVVTAVMLREPAALYRHLGRQPSAERVKHGLAGLRGRPDLLPQARDLVDEVGAAWERGVARIGLAPHDVVGLEQIIALAAAANARQRESPAPEVDFRSFSRIAVGDSKALERHLTGVAKALMRMFPELADRGHLRPGELLASLGISRLPQPLLVSGPLWLDGSAMPPLPFVGVPVEEAHRLRIADKPPYMLTIENYASFVRHVREVSLRDGAVVIFSGGFPSRPALSAIANLAGQIRAPVFHWGDMDAGGVRIFRHLEVELQKGGVKLRPHLMNAELLQKVGIRPGQGLRPNFGNISGSAVEELGKLIASERLVHEQEELTPAAPDIPGATDASESGAVAQ
jgi:hypothetical protein